MVECPVELVIASSGVDPCAHPAVEVTVIWVHRCTHSRQNCTHVTELSAVGPCPRAVTGVCASVVAVSFAVGNGVLARRCMAVATPQSAVGPGPGFVDAEAGAIRAAPAVRIKVVAVSAGGGGGRRRRR